MQLHYDLFNCYSSKVHATIAAPEKDFICCVEWEGAWYRAIIDEIGKENTCKVRLIDSGGITWTKWSKLCVLEENFAHLPAYSARCKLSDIEASEASTEWFETFCGKSEDAFVHINTVHADGCCDVLLYSSDGSGGYICINTIVPKAPKISNESDNGSVNRSIASAPNKTIHPEMVDILHVDSLETFFIVLEQDKAGIQRLETDVQKYACCLDPSTVSNCEWKMNDYCLVQVKLSNKSPHYWYRAQIVKVSNKVFDVYLRDEGITVAVNDCLRIRPIDDRVCDVRDRAIKCRLSGIRPIKEFMDIVNEFDRLAISIHEKPSDCTFPILLWGGKMKYDEDLLLHFEWNNINRLLVDKGLAKMDENFELIDIIINDEPEIKERIAIEVENEMENINFVGDAIGRDIDFGIKPALGHDEYDLSDEIEDVDEWLPSDKIFKAKYGATVTYVSTKCVLYVLDAYRRYVADSMQKKITEHVMQVMQQELQTGHNTDWIRVVGQACFARFMDRKYYRASIRRICRKNDNCIVRFIDYGNVEVCKMKNIYPAVLFGNVPTLTQSYLLANIRPAYEKAECDERGQYRWPKAVTDYCYNNLVDRRCVIHVIDDFSDGINTCELFVGGSDIEFGAKLVGDDMASYVETFF